MKTKQMDVFWKINFDPEDIERIAKLDFTQVGIFPIGSEPERIDFLSKVQGLDFDNAYERKQTLMVKGRPLFFLHFDDLIASKLIANRKKDHADIENLIKINHNKK